MLNTFEIKNDDCEWKLLWIAATVLFAVSIIINHSVYYSYIYFFIAGLIAFYISRLKYATFDKNGLTIYFGIPINRNKLFVEWSNIESFNCATIPKKWRTALKFNFDTARLPEDDDVVQITLKNPFAKRQKEALYETLNYYLIKKFKISQDRTKIYLYSAADRSFSEIVKAGNMFLKEGKVVSIPNNRKKGFKSLTLSDIVIIFIPIVLVLIKLKR